MRVEEFLSTMDALRFDTDLDETNPELRGMVTKVYPYLRKIYNMMYESGMITEAHGVKKHNTPKDKRAAERKGNRDAEKDMFGDGFKSKNKIHKIKNYNRRDNKKVSIEDNDMNESKNIVRLSESELKNMVQESVKRIVKESYMDIPDANKTFDSDNDYITVSVPSDKFGELKHQIGVKMKELGYVYQDVGQNGNKAMITYRRIGI
jgi:predicted RND superfamily exporter protein